jgi:hypothetical protein
MESFRRYIDYQKLYYVKARREFLEHVEKSGGSDDQANYLSKNKQAFDLVFETLAEQLKQEDKAIEKMRMRLFYHNDKTNKRFYIYNNDYWDK